MYFVLFTILFSTLSLAQDSKELKKKIDEIDKEILKTSKSAQEGDNAGIFKQHLEKLIKEKAQYEKLLKQVSKSTKSSKISEDQNSRKILPSVVRQDLEKFKVWQDETLPLEKRYDLILSEMSNLYEMNGRLTGLETKDEEILKTIKENKTRLKQLEELKVEYEIKIREADDHEFSEQKKAGVRVGMMADIYYQWDFNKPRRTTDGSGSGEILYKNYTNRHNDLTINLLEINVAKSYKRMDAYADIDFGEQPEQNKPNSSDPIATHLGQAFLRYRPKMFNDTSLTVGKFYSHFGYEVSKNIENRTYSRPFYYTLVCPFWHEGVSVNRSNLGPFSVSGFIYDRTDDRVDNNSGKTYGLQVGYTFEKLSATYNGISGSELNSAGGNTEGNYKTQHEVILSYQATEKLTLITDAVIGKNEGYDVPTGKDQSWYSLVGYADYKTHSTNSLGLRVENFTETTSSKAVNNLFYTDANPSVKPPSIMAYTLTNRYNLGQGAEIRAELRYDNSNKKIFSSDTEGDFVKDQTTITLGWLYSI
jgi:hypothetical protein